jgi:hypothetical protein
MKNLFAGMAAILLILGQVRAQTIIDDRFTGADGTVITSHKPDTDLPGSSYIGTNTGGSSGTGSEAPLIENRQLQADGTSSAAISISSNSSANYNKPTTLTISAKLTETGIASNTTFSRGIGLGFYSVAPNGKDYPIDNFTGVILNSQNGNLELFYPGGDTLTANHPFIAYDASQLGPFSANGTYTLSYTINTSTGEITSISLSNSHGTQTATGFKANAPNGKTSTVNCFTEANTSYVAVLAATNGASPEFSCADDFLVTGPDGASGL